MKLIDKDAVVTMVEERRQLIRPKNDSKVRVADVPTHIEQGWLNALTWVRDSINSLEVKEVDLKKELIEWHKEHFKKDGTFIGMSGFYLTNNSQMDIAKHFFELGLKVQKGKRYD